MSKTIAIALAAFLTILTACDNDHGAAECPSADVSASNGLVIAAPPDAPPPEELSFREQGPPSAITTSKISGAPIKRAAVAKLILSAGDLPDPAQTCTLSWYQLDTAKDERVLGLGCSMLAPLELWDFYRQMFLNNGP